MRRSFLRWLGVAAVATATLAGCRRAAAPPEGVPHTDSRPTEHTLTVAFWNLEWFPGRRPNARDGARAAHVAAVLPVVARLAPDVLGLEEVADHDAAATVAAGLPGFKVDVCSEFLRGPETRPRRRSSPARDAAPSPVAPAEAPPPEDGTALTLPDRQQVALCSRLPLLAAGAQPWQPDASGRRQRRGFVWAAYRAAPGEVVLVYGLHLKSNVVDEPGGQPANVLRREEASRQLLVHAQAAAARWTAPERLRLLVVGGDMNTSLDDPAFAAERTLRGWLDAGFRWGWEGVPLPRRLTLPAKGRYPATCFDHVFYRAGGDLAPPAASLGDSGFDASDHRPILARFSW